jgi:uridine kinase
VDKTTIIAISGASASGKSLLADTVYKELLPDLGIDGITILKEDSYYRAQDHLSMDLRKKTNYDHPKAFEHELLIEQLDELIAGNTINCPVYCYNTHTRKSEIIELKPAKVVIVEGILLLSNKNLLDRFDIKVYMDTPLDLCLIRRIQRDVLERGRSLDSIIKQYSETVRPMFYQFIEPSKAWADISVSRGGKNRIAIGLLKAKISQLSKSD